jgi:NAD(P)H-dependent FMN reductase
MKNIVIIAASDNNNLSLANEFSIEVEKQGHVGKVVNISALDLPLYSTVNDKQGTPAKINAEVELLNNADAMVFVAPEYNGGIPPLLTNYIAWISRSGNEDWRSCFNEKPAAIATHSGGAGTHVLMAMRSQLSFIGMNVLGREILTNYKKQLNADSLTAVVSMLIK